jgi:hypothetical protein
VRMGASPWKMASWMEKMIHDGKMMVLYGNHGDFAGARLSGKPISCPGVL